MSWPAWVNGVLVPTVEAAVSVHDRGLRSGEGVFTTMRVVAGRPVDLDAHVARTRRGLLTLGLDAPPAAVLADSVHELLAAIDHDADLAVRLLVTPGPVDPVAMFPPRPHPRAAPTVVVTAHPAPPLQTVDVAAVSAVTSPLRRPLPSVKTSSYVVETVAVRRAREAGADTALLLDDQRQLLEGATANVAVLFGTTLATRPDDGSVLAGTLLPRLLAAAAAVGGVVERRPVHVAELRQASALLLTSAVSGVVRVEELDGAPAVGRDDSALAARLAEAVVRDLRHDLPAERPYHRDA